MYVFVPIADMLEQEPHWLPDENAVREWYRENRLFKRVDKETYVWKTLLEPSATKSITVRYAPGKEVVIET